ncbi:MAG: NAD(P)-dependent oxidoreductase [Burkholderiaceae bacterium]|nr:NAD(P)-dependent oxidoreductase [Burkholderiaceae bacterium]
MTQQTIGKRFKRILLTGAAGGLGKVLRERIKPWADVIRLSDISDMGPAQAGEEIVQCDLADKASVLKLLEGVDAVLHFGGISVEQPFEPIMQANILGMNNLYEAAYKSGVNRIVYASSNHAVGYYPNTTLVDANMPMRPDGFYGLSKCFGELLSRYYFDRFGLETVCLRIGSSFPEPRNPRMMVTYLSYDDLVELVRCSLFTPRVDHTIAFGVSDNRALWVDNRHASHLGYRPKDSSETFADRFPATSDRPEKNDPATIYQGGPFTITGPMFE